MVFLKGIAFKVFFFLEVLSSEHAETFSGANREMMEMEVCSESDQFMRLPYKGGGEERGHANNINPDQNTESIERRPRISKSTHPEY